MIVVLTVSEIRNALPPTQGAHKLLQYVNRKKSTGNDIYARLATRKHLIYAVSLATLTCMTFIPLSHLVI